MLLVSFTMPLRAVLSCPHLGTCQSVSLQLDLGVRPSVCPTAAMFNLTLPSAVNPFAGHLDTAELFCLRTGTRDAVVSLKIGMWGGGYVVE